MSIIHLTVAREFDVAYQTLRLVVAQAEFDLDPRSLRRGRQMHVVDSERHHSEHRAHNSEGVHEGHG